ncbi:hypothetical protein [Thiobacillus sp.]
MTIKNSFSPGIFQPGIFQPGIMPGVSTYGAVQICGATSVFRWLIIPATLNLSGKLVNQEFRLIPMAYPELLQK